jgi:peptidyl-prolyl cis-trans isomerase SurA
VRPALSRHRQQQRLPRPSRQVLDNKARAAVAELRRTILWLLRAFILDDQKRLDIAGIPTRCAGRLLICSGYTRSGDTRLQADISWSNNRRSVTLMLLSAMLLAAATGCNHKPAPDVVATVNGKDILRSDLDRQYQIWKMSQGQSPQEPSPEQADLAKLVVLRQMIDEEILQQRAASQNVTASDEDVNAALTQKKLPYTQEEFDKQLKQYNETLDDFKRDLRHGLTENKLLNKEIDSKINITDAEITNFYAAHKSDFNLIEPRYNIARIAVTGMPGPQTANVQNNKASSDADAKSKIQALHQKLQNGEDFSVVAMNFSEDKDTGSNGGDMGFVYESQLRGTTDVYNAMSKLAPGQFTDVMPIVDPVSHKTVGYAIYKLISKEAAGQRTLTDVRVQAAIRQRLREGHGQLLRNAYSEALRNDAKVHNYFADQILREGSK